jgi:hypothetical protein
MGMEREHQVCRRSGYRTSNTRAERFHREFAGKAVANGVESGIHDELRYDRRFRIEGRGIVKKSTVSRIAILLGGLAALSLSACASTAPRPAPSDRIPGVTSAYEKLTEHHRRWPRRPYREEEDRAMRALAEQADQLAQESAKWSGDAHLAAAGETEQQAIRDEIGRLRASLTGLKTAAEQHNINAIENHYATLLASYRNIQIALAEER